MTKAAAKEDLDLDRLRGEVSDLRDKLFRSRARAQTLQNALFSTKVLIALRFGSPRRYLLKSAVIELDDALIWEQRDRKIDEDNLTVAELGLAPGAHTVTLRIDLRSRDSDRLGYTSEQRFAIDVVEGRRNRVDLAIREEGDLPSFKPTVAMEVGEAK